MINHVNIRVKGKDMKRNNLLNKCMVLAIIVIFCSLAVTSAIGTYDSFILERKGKDTPVSSDYPLPPPMTVDMNLEESIFRRMSVREFTEEPVTDEELSTVLWAACGFIDGEKQTISGIDGVHAGIIYVLNEDAAYKYDPLNHSLVFYRAGDWRDIVGWQYEAPIQLGLCWDTDKADANFGGAELGQIGQNIQFMANALDLGTVVTGQIPPAIDPLEIPENEEGMIVMPLGHPEHPYNFKYRPLWISLLPRIKESSMSLTTALEERNDGTSFAGEVTRKEISHLLWSSYGFSYYLDKSESEMNPLKRHRTVPSAHGYYPLYIYAVTESGIYKYYPNILTRFYPFPVDYLGIPIVTFMLKIKHGDHRSEIAQASSQPSIASAPLLIITVLDLDMTRPEGYDDFSGEIYRRLWYYESGASAHNIMLEATTLNLTSNIVLPTDTDTIGSLLNLNEVCIPLFIVPVGK